MSATAGLAGKNRQSGESPLLFVSASPHLRGNGSVPRIMLITIAALVPALLISVIRNGLHVFFIAVLSVTAAAATEWVLAVAKKKRFVMIDGSAGVTGLLCAFTLPPQLPLWMAPFGSVFAIVIVKTAFGGLGRNFLNPALAGRAFCALVFPALFSAAAVSAGDTFQNFIAGYQDLWTACALLTGAVVLWFLRIIDFTLPVTFVSTAFALFWFSGGNNDEAVFSALFQICSGSLVLIAFFMATDPVTSPTAPGGRFLFGAGCGVLAFLFRKSNDGVIYAVLLMNCIVPYLDRYCGRRPFGMRLKRDLRRGKELKSA